MIRLPRAAFAGALVLALALAGSAIALPKLPRILPAKPPAAAAPAPKLAPGQWPQAHSDLAADPAVRFGALPNGMRYAILKNATPPGQASFRLRFNSGSLQETDAQAGLAHFLEHAAFLGSTHVPRGEMIKILERHGLAFGPDTNAHTQFNETTYELDLPKADEDSLDTSLMLLRETASELTLDQAAIDNERGVVLSEERSRDGPAYRIFKGRMAFQLEGQRPPLRFPIGQVAVIQNATRDQLADYYRKYYRPERAVLIAVGDFDVDAMEAKIKAKFGDWAASGSAGIDPDLGTVEQRALQTKLIVEAGAPTSIQFAWVNPPDLAADTKEHRRRDLAERLGFSVLNRRLATMARTEHPPFIAAGAFAGNQLQAARITSMFVQAENGGWQTALTTAEQEQRRAVQYGVRPDELAREIAELDTAFKQAASQAATRRTPGLAEELAGTLDDDTVETSPAQDLAMFEELVKGMTPEIVSAALKNAFQGNGPLIFATSPVPIPGAETAVRTAFENSRRHDVTAPTALANLTWPYGDFGTPGKVVEQREISDLDAVFVRFENGVRLTIKPTKFRDDQVLVKVRIGDGLRSIPADHPNLTWAGYAFLEGGYGKITTNDTERVFAAASYNTSYRIEDDAFTLGGETRRDDVPVQMQVLAAYLVDPGWRPEAMERRRTFTATLLDQFAVTDSGVFGRDLGGLMHAGDRRWTFPSRQDITAATLDDLKAQMQPAMSGGAIEVTVVGDITVEKAIEAVAATFGALPPRPAPKPPGSETVGFPAANTTPVVLTHTGRADQSIGFMAWRTTDFFADMQAARDAAVLGEVFQLRLTDLLRQTQGATYSPRVDYNASSVWKGWGYISAQVEVPPAKLDAFFADAAKIAADLRNVDISADDLTRAKLPRIDDIQRRQATNEYWRDRLAGAQADPRRLDAVRSELSGVERVSIADVRRAAQRFLKDDAAWRLMVVPAAAQAAGQAPATP